MPPKQVITIAHRDDSRRNNPTAEMEAVMDDSQRQPIQIAYERRNRNLDPQLVWRGKDEQDISDLIVAAPPLFTQEKVHPKALVNDLMRVSKQRKAQGENRLNSHHWTSSPTSTVWMIPTPAPSSTNTTSTGATG